MADPNSTLPVGIYPSGVNNLNLLSSSDGEDTEVGNEGFVNRYVKLGSEIKPPGLSCINELVTGTGNSLSSRMVTIDYSALLMEIYQEKKRFDKCIARDLFRYLNTYAAETNEMICVRYRISSMSTKIHPVILSIAQDELEGDGVRIEAAKMLYTVLGDVSHAVSVLGSIIQREDSDLEYRFMAIGALGDIPKQKEVAAKFWLEMSENPRVFPEHRLSALVELLYIDNYTQVAAIGLLSFVKKTDIELNYRIEAAGILLDIDVLEEVAVKHLFEFAGAETKSTEHRLSAAMALSKVSGRENLAAHALLEVIHDASIPADSRIDGVFALSKIYGYESVAAYLLIIFIQDKTIKVASHAKALRFLAKIPNQEMIHLGTLMSYSEKNKLPDEYKKVLRYINKREFEPEVEKPEGSNAYKPSFLSKMKELREQALPSMLEALLSNDPARLTFITKLFERAAVSSGENVSIFNPLDANRQFTDFLICSFIKKTITDLSEAQSAGQNLEEVTKYNLLIFNTLCHLGVKGEVDELCTRGRVYLTLMQLVDRISLSSLATYLKENGYAELYPEGVSDDDEKDITLSFLVEVGVLSEVDKIMILS